MRGTHLQLQGQHSNSTHFYPAQPPGIRHDCSEHLLFGFQSLPFRRSSTTPMQLNWPASSAPPIANCTD